jgi:hypothetical protein
MGSAGGQRQLGCGRNAHNTALSESDLLSKHVLECALYPSKLISLTRLPVLVNECLLPNRRSSLEFPNYDLGSLCRLVIKEDGKDQVVYKATTFDVHSAVH